MPPHPAQDPTPHPSPGSADPLGAPPGDTTAEEVVQLWSVTKRFVTGGQTVTALDDVTVGFRAGTCTAVMGPSGSGKSTLMHCCAGLERPDEGAVHTAGVDLASLSERRLTLLRRDRIGFVFQSFNLVAALTAAQNVALPLRLAGQRAPENTVRQGLAAVGLADRADHRPSQLSGGQQQRVALARALVARPEVLFADEPTGSLDAVASREVLALLRSLVDEHGLTVITVTHDPLVAAAADRLVFLAEGRIVDDVDRDGSTGWTAEELAARMAHLESAGTSAGSR